MRRAVRFLPVARFVLSRRRAVRLLLRFRPERISAARLLSVSWQRQSRLPCLFVRRRFGEWFSRLWFVWLKRPSP